jgi:hypothetical protein
MKKHGPRFYNSILAIGMLLIIVGFLMFVIFSEETESITAVLWPVLLMICGSVFLYFTMSFTKGSFQLFLGLFLTSYGVFSILFSSGIIPYGINEWWPVAVIDGGFSLLAAGYYKHKKMLFSYVVAAVSLVILGALFLFFSFHIIRGSFRNFVTFVGPFILIAAGLFMVLLFLFQKKHSRFHLRDESDEMNDDNGFFAD